MSCQNDDPDGSNLPNQPRKTPNALDEGGSHPGVISGLRDLSDRVRAFAAARMKVSRSDPKLDEVEHELQRRIDQALKIPIQEDAEPKERRFFRARQAYDLKRKVGTIWVRALKSLNDTAPPEEVSHRIKEFARTILHRDLVKVLRDLHFLEFADKNLVFISDENVLEALSAAQSETAFVQD